MSTFHFCSMPDYYVQLLKENMQGIEFNHSWLNSYVYENKPLLALIENHFQDIDADLRVDAILKAMTWRGVRNRLARLFIHYELNGRFGLDENDHRHLDDILKFEQTLGVYGVETISRAFLIGFYLKMVQLKNGHENKELKIESGDLFRYCKTRVERIDWVFVMLESFLGLHGKKKLLALLEDRFSYEQIFNSLKKEDQAFFIQNMLQYGASIFESEIFINDLILV